MSMPTVPVLCECLRDLGKPWQLFAQYLPGIGQADIRTIETDKPSNSDEQKRILYGKWLAVYPNASWDDIVKALENPAVRENAIAQQLRDKYLRSRIESTNSSVIIERFKEEILTELDTLQESFVDLTDNLKSEISEQKAKSNTIINRIVFRVQEERAFPIPSLESVQTTDELFRAIRPHHNFLNCHLIVKIALFLCGVIAEKATTYNKRMNTFMKTTNIEYLKNTLKRYCPQRFRGCSNTTIVVIEVENGWGDQPLWLVRKLIETLFPVKHPDELPWYDIVPGSVIMTFTALEHMTSSLIESSRKKTEFMRLIGVVSLKIGGELVWANKIIAGLHKHEERLILATSVDNIEAVKFILQYDQVDINAPKSPQLFWIESANETMTSKIPEDEIISTLRSFRVMFDILVEDIEQVLQYMKKPSGHPNHEFLNTQNLSEVSPHLPKPLSRRVEQYIQSLENSIKKRLMIPDFAEHFLAKYFPTRFPGSIKVTICLYSIWSSVWYVEQLGQLIFTPTLFYQMQWFKIDKREETICFLAHKKIMNSLKECVTKIESRLSMLEVVSVQVDDTLKIINSYSDGYNFHEAIKLAKEKGDNEVFTLLQQVQNPAMCHYEVSSIDNNGNCSFHLHPDSTPLMIACCNDNSQLVQLLLNHNADPNIQNGRGVTALMYSTGNSKIFQMLLDHGAEHANIVTIYNESLIHFACFAGNVKVVKQLLQRSDPQALLNIQDTITGNTPLIIASVCGHVQVVAVLLRAGADPDIQNNKGSTALIKASKNGDEEIVKQLLQANADPDIRNNDHTTAVYFTKDNNDIVDQLVKANANLNLDINSAALQQAIIGDEDVFPDDDDAANVKLEELKRQFSTSSESDKLGISLCVAIKVGASSLAKALIKQGIANPDISFWGVTPLLTAIEEGYLELVQKLLQAQADPNMQDDDGRTPLMIAYDEQEGENQRTMIQMLLQVNANPNIMDGEGNTILTKACHDQNTALVDILLEAKTDPNIQDGNGKTPLRIACNKPIEIVKKLLQAKANPNIQDIKGWTPLMISCYNDDVKLVSMLLLAGADPTIINNKGNTALNYATEDVIVDMLLDTIYQQDC